MDFLKEAYTERKKILGDRINFWKDNEKNCEKNCEILLNYFLKEFKINKRWKVKLIVGNFVDGKSTKPFDYFSYSVTDLTSASKKQGKEFLIFLNKARIGFLSKTALIPLIVHELKHVKQGILNPRGYLLSVIDDKLSEKLEKEADLAIRKIKNWEEFRKQQVLESVLYCYDYFGWEGAEKMALFFYKGVKTIYGDGYLGDMTQEEFEIFLEAKKKKNISIFTKLF
jgi:hypothetical protein